MKTFRSVAAAFGLVAVLAAGAAQADPLTDPAQTTHCLALSQVFAAKSDGLIEKNRALNAAFPNPDADQAAIIARTSKLQAQLAQIAESLNSVYGDAPAPAQAERDGLAPLPLKDLVVQVQACLN